MRLSGPAHGGASGERRAVDLNNLVEEALNLAYHGARAQDQNFNIALERDLDHNITPIELVPQDVTRVLLNRTDRVHIAAKVKLGGPAYSTLTVNLLKPRRMLCSARSSFSMWNRLTLRASAVNRARISSLARFMPRHMCGPAPNAI
jgi:hypothetical protein